MHAERANCACTCRATGAIIQADRDQRPCVAVGDQHGNLRNNFTAYRGSRVMDDPFQDPGDGAVRIRYFDANLVGAIDQVDTRPA